MSTISKKGLLRKKKVKTHPINKQRAINYALITSEYQTAKMVGEYLRTALPGTFTQFIDARIDTLEQLARTELMVVWSISTRSGELGKTAIYGETEGDVMFKLYLESLTDPYSTTPYYGLDKVSLYRRLSDVLYTLNAPVFKVNNFIQHDAFKALLKNIDDEESLKIHETLFYVFNTPSSGFKDLLNKAASLDILHKETLDTLILDETII